MPSWEEPPPAAATGPGCQQGPPQPPWLREFLPLSTREGVQPGRNPQAGSILLERKSVSEQTHGTVFASVKCGTGRNTKSRRSIDTVFLPWALTRQQGKVPHSRFCKSSQQLVSLPQRVGVVFRQRQMREAPSKIFYFERSCPSFSD